MSVDANARVPISADGYEDRCRELGVLRTEARHDLAARMREARQDGDVSDNPVLQELLDEHERLERRIAALEAQLAVAEIAAPASNGRAGVGSVVSVRDADGAISDYELVGPLESDASKGRVSIVAPVGQALVGREAGSRVDFQTPRGPLSLEVVSVRPALRKRAAALEEARP